MAGTEHAQKLKKKAQASLTLLLVAVISITTATYAWFTLTSSTSVQSMVVQVATGTLLRVRDGNLAYSTNIDDYKSTLTVEEVNTALQNQQGYQLDAIRLWPFTSGNGHTLYTQNSNGVPAQIDKGVTAEGKNYLELSLWFMSNENMQVYLNGDSAPDAPKDKPNGTLVSSAAENTDARKPVDRAVRLSFTAFTGGNNQTAVESTAIYEPNKDGATTLKGNALSNSAGGATQETFVDLGTNLGTGHANTPKAPPVIFSLTKDVPKKVVLRIWLEGEDPQCVNGNGDAANKLTDITKAVLETRLRFCGADDKGNMIEGGTT